MSFIPVSMISAAVQPKAPATKPNRIILSINTTSHESITQSVAPAPPLKAPPLKIEFPAIGNP